MNFGVLFSGQGSQKPGMGLDFLSDSLFAQTIDEASQICHFDLRTIFKSENGELNQTLYVQPALVSFEVGIWKMLMRDTNLKANSMIGLSLGEYSALLASQAMNFADGVALVCDRAKYMQDDSDKVNSTMAAVLNPNWDELKQLIAKQQKSGQQIYFCNYNSPKQVVLGGTVDAINDVIFMINDQKIAKKAISLNVSGAFHTPLYDNASKKMYARLKNMTFKTPTSSVISNTFVKPFAKDNIAQIMEIQLARPTHFADCVEYMQKNYPIDTTLEIGPGKTLSSFSKKVNRNFGKYRIGSLSEYEKFVEGYQNEFKK